MENFLDKIKNFFSNKINHFFKKPETKSEQKRMVKMVSIIAVILIVSILCVVFIPKLIPSSKKTWDMENASEGKNIPTALSIPVETKPEEYTDKYDFKYLRTNITSLGVSMLLPEGWKVKSDSSTGNIYITDESKSTSHIELCIMNSSINNKHSSTLIDAFSSKIKEQLEYHNTYTFSVTNMSVTSTSDIYDKNSKVFVNTGNIKDYQFYTEKPSDMTNIEEQDKYIGAYQSFKLSMHEKTNGGGGNYTTAKPYNAFYYTYNNMTGICISCLGPQDNSLQIEEIAKTVVFSIKQIQTDADSKLLILDKEKSIDNFHFNYSSDFTENLVSGNKVLMRLSDNYKLPEYGIELMVLQTRNDKDISTSSTLSNNEITNEVFNSYSKFSLDFDLTEEQNKIVASELTAKSVRIGGKTANQYDYILDLKYDNQNIKNQISFDLPVYNTIAIIDDGYYSYSVNVRYSQQNKDLAMQYFNSFVSKITFS